MKERSAFGQKTLSGNYFFDESIFAQEKKKLFATHWLYVGRAQQIAQTGQYFLQTIGAESLIFVRDQDGEVRGFYNVCRHRGTQICTETSGSRLSFQCPYHAWTYGLDGRLLGAPTMQDVQNFDPAEYGLHPVETAVWEGFIFVNLDPNPIPFAKAFAPLMGKFSAWQLDSLTIGHQIIYDVAANWKIIFHNYSECYHCPTIHPRLNELTPFRNSYNDLEEGFILGGPMQMSLADGSMTMSGRICAPILQESKGLVHYYTIMPTIFLSIFPDYVVTHQLRPISPTHTQIICEWLFAPNAQADPNFNPQDAIDFWNMTNQQDWHVCELTQKGAQSKAYLPGPYSELESMLAAFDRAYLHVMNS